MNKTLLEQIAQLIEASKKQKEEINKICLAHISKWSPTLIHDSIHHCLNFEQVPTRFDNETDFEFESRCIQIRRRLINENRLAGCLIMLMEDRCIKEEMNNEENDLH